MMQIKPSWQPTPRPLVKGKDVGFEEQFEDEVVGKVTGSLFE